jgi:hypothetical protein
MMTEEYDLLLTLINENAVRLEHIASHTKQFFFALNINMESAFNAMKNDTEEIKELLTKFST